MTIGDKPISDSTYQLFNEGSKDVLNNSQAYINVAASIHDVSSIKSDSSGSGSKIGAWSFGSGTVE